MLPSDATDTALALEATAPKEPLPPPGLLDQRAGRRALARRAATPVAAVLPTASAGAASTVRGRTPGWREDGTAPSLPRSLGSRLLDAALRILSTSDHIRAEARQHHLADTAQHAHTQQLVRELGCMLNLPAHPGERVAKVVPRAPADQLPGAGEAEADDASESTPSLEIYLLSPFRVFANDRAIDGWPNCKGKSIFKYLATHRAQPVAKEVLMDLFWPEAERDAARNNLNVAIYGLRKALAVADPSFPFVLFRQGCYSFNPALRLWIDADAFVECVERGRAADQRGEHEEAIAAYRVAQAVYHSPLLVDDRYEDWLKPQRQGLQDSYMKALMRLASHDYAREDFEACVASTERMLEVDNCNEEAHRLLMRCYGRMGHAHLALRQYHFCIDALARELNLIPSAQTVALFQQIRRRLPV